MEDLNSFEADQGRSVILENKQKNVVWQRAAIVMAGIAANSLAHYLTPHSMVLLHSTFQHLYFVPIVLGAIFFGWQGGVLAAACTALCYYPHIHDWEAISPLYAVSQYAELGSFFLIGAVVGILADRERKKKKELEKTTLELGRVYQELQESFEQVKRADRLSAMGQLSASLAHEIRTPLSSIEGAVGIIEQAPNSEERRNEFSAIIKKECRRLNHLLTSLLDFARPRSPEFKLVQLEPLIDSVVSLTAHLAEKKGLAIRQEIPARLPSLECDPDQLKQVLLNLMLNAIQAMPEGGEISIGVCRQDSRMRIQVKDQGAGLSQQSLERIFEPFFTTKAQGTGLGLFVASQIVTQHQGAITAAQNADRGVVFSILLPLRHGKRDDETQTAGG